MFSNSGKKIKKLSKILFWVLVVSSIILGFAYGLFEDGLIILLLVVPFICWIICLFLYSWGEHVENVEFIKNSTDKENKSNYQNELLDELLSQGLLTQEEYEKAKDGTFKIM